MHKSATKCNETIGKWCKNKHGASKIIDTLEMYQCSGLPAPIVKGDKFGEFQCLRNQIETDQMKSVPYVSAVGSIMYAQVCTRPDLAFVTTMLGKFQSNQGLDHQKDT
jgi:hypothetical protein